MRRLLPTLPLLALALLAGCGGPDDSTPVACLEGSPAYLRALRRAPDAVKLRGETPISACLAENQSGGDLATVGAALLRATTKLNSEARADPGGDASLRLGYLLGAVTGGAEDTEGIHAELLRRLAAAAAYSPGERPLPTAFEKTYREGFEAGRGGG
jgi:hypothetical protein